MGRERGRRIYGGETKVIKVMFAMPECLPCTSYSTTSPMGMALKTMATHSCGLCWTLGKSFLVVVDAHSKWPEVFEMSSTTALKTIATLRHLFATYGLPEQLVSDSGPQFTSEEFQTFMKQNGIKHIRCAPYHPSSNGAAEQFVQTFKASHESK